MAGSVISQRLDTIDVLKGKHRMIEKGELREFIDQAREIATGDGLGTVQNLNGRDLESQAIGRWLLDQELGNESVRVLWLSHGEGTLIRFEDFLNHFDELWFPGSDDIIVVSESKKFVVRIDHEEQVSLVFLNE